MFFLTGLNISHIFLYIQIGYDAPSLLNRSLQSDEQGIIHFSLFWLMLGTVYYPQKPAPNIKFDVIFSIFSTVLVPCLEPAVQFLSHTRDGTVKISPHTPNLSSTLTLCGQQIQGFIPQNCIYPPQTDITYFYVWALIMFLLCIKHGKPVPINVLMLCCDFLKVWQQRGEIESLGAVLYCGISLSPEIYNFMHVEKNVKET